MSDNDERRMPVIRDVEAIASLAGLGAVRALEIRTGKPLSRIAEAHAAVAREATRLYEQQLSGFGGERPAGPWRSTRRVAQGAIRRASWPQ